MNICPFLGLRNDTTLHMAFGSSKNSCHHCKPVVPIKLDHQNHYCLDPIYISCPVYLDALDRRMPKQFIPTGWVNHRPHPKAKHILLIRASLAGIFLVIVIAFILASKEHAKNSIRGEEISDRNGDKLPHAYGNSFQPVSWKRRPPFLVM